MCQSVDRMSAPRRQMSPHRGHGCTAVHPLAGLLPSFQATTAHSWPETH